MKKQVENWLHYSEIDLVTVEKIKSDSFLNYPKHMTWLHCLGL